MNERTEDQEWLSQLEQDALTMGAYDFALKHKVYNLPVWERMQESPKLAAMLSMSTITLGQIRQFLIDCMADLSPEDILTSDLGQWLNYTIQKIDTIIEAYPYPHENLRKAETISRESWDEPPSSTYGEGRLRNPDSVSTQE